MSFSDGDTTVTRTILPSGVRIISQDVPATRSVGVSMWVPVGSRDELPEHAGSTHFLEHLLFKGTAARSALDIASAFDGVGGESNAGTGKETTDYWARVLDADLPMAVETLTDMVTGSLLTPEAFETERGVILDELAMSEDSPTEVVHEAFQLAIHGDTPLGRPIGGTSEIIQAVQRDDVWAHYQTHYAPNNLVVAAAGNVNHDALVEKVIEELEKSSWADAMTDYSVPRPRRSTDSANATYRNPSEGPDAGDIIRYRDVEQAHIVIGTPSMRVGDERRPVMSVLLSVLGGSMSSRLFQEVREKRGLAYSTYAFDSAYSEAGAFGMYAGTSPSKLAEVERIMTDQLHLLAADGPTEEELVRVRGQLRGGLALGLEDNWSRMSRVGRSEIQGRYLTVSAALQRLEAVTAEQVRELATELASHPLRRAVVMPKNR
ncbi:M16 family metallopeptidase [Schaalia canis]|uniref:Insulinase family protein n=1 Tax=Schaalia canis TaxID=100469 RepID=A0A3P1SHV0_9ACTO|nr:pitrilysin family protein [Schaalia canis]RRC96584.1 insulinase family protein [Schaalia canis]